MHDLFPAYTKPSCGSSPACVSLPSTYRVHVGQLLGHHVSLERQEVILDFNLHFVLFPQAERAIAMETS